MTTEHVSVPREFISELESIQTAVIDAIKGDYDISLAMLCTRLTAILSRATPSASISKEAKADLVACDWQEGALFYVTDDPDEHKPCYLVMPDGACLILNHHAKNGVDQARAQFIADCCNQVLCPIQEPRKPTAPRVVTDEYGEPATQKIDKALGEISNALEDVYTGKPASFITPFLREASEYLKSARDDIESFATSLPAARVPAGWFPIETAPNDGTMHVRGLHVFSSIDGQFLYWDAVVGHIDTEDGLFRDQGGDLCGWEANDFTHWHPLAAAPQAGETK